MIISETYKRLLTIGASYTQDQSDSTVYLIREKRTVLMELFCDAGVGLLSGVVNPD